MPNALGETEYYCPLCKRLMAIMRPCQHIQTSEEALQHLKQVLTERSKIEGDRREKRFLPALRALTNQAALDQVSPFEVVTALMFEIWSIGDECGFTLDDLQTQLAETFADADKAREHLARQDPTH